MRKTKSPYLSIVGWGMYLAGALALGSCTNDDIPGKDEQGPAIEFGEVKTRAEVTAASQIKEFGVFAEQNYLNDDGTESTDFISLLDNERVYRMVESQDGDFTYDNTRYWVDERTFNFFAVYPYMETGVARDAFTQSDLTYDGYTINFTTPTTADTDLMAAHKTERTTESTTDYPTVNFQFGHLLSKVNLIINKDSEKNADDTFTITEIKLSGIKQSGVYSTSRWNAYTDNWSINATPTMNYTIASPTYTVSTNGTDAVCSLILLPQKAESISLSMTYQYKQSGSDESSIKQVQTTLPAGTWAPDNQYNYRITLSVDNYIYIATPTVESWGAMQSGATIIIK